MLAGVKFLAAGGLVAGIWITGFGAAATAGLAVLIFCFVL